MDVKNGCFAEENRTGSLEVPTVFGGVDAYAMIQGYAIILGSSRYLGTFFYVARVC